MSANYLAIDTATEACSVALRVGPAVHERYELAVREHTQRLPAMIRAVMGEAGLAPSQLDGIACSVGPGSFAGVRIGVGLAKGLALSHDLPVVGVSTLAMLAQPVLQRQPGATVAAVIDARLQEVYCGVYRSGPNGAVQAVEAERVCAPGEVSRASEGLWLGVGSGWASYAQELARAFGATFAVDGKALPRASAALVLAGPALEAGQGQPAEHLVPVYLRNRVALTLAEQRARATGTRTPGNVP